MSEPGGAPTEGRWVLGRVLAVSGIVWIVLSGLCTGYWVLPSIGVHSARGYRDLGLIIGLPSMAEGLAVALAGYALFRRGGLSRLAWTGFVLMQVSIALCVLAFLARAAVELVRIGFVLFLIGFVLFLIGFVLRRPVSHTGSRAGSGGDER